ncbi:unnamed protein product [Chrysoparadoxa australica]
MGIRHVALAALLYLVQCLGERQSNAEAVVCALDPQPILIAEKREPEVHGTVFDGRLLHKTLVSEGIELLAQLKELLVQVVHLIFSGELPLSFVGMTEEMLHEERRRLEEGPHGEPSDFMLEKASDLLTMAFDAKADWHVEHLKARAAWEKEMDEARAAGRETTLLATKEPKLTACQTDEERDYALDRHFICYLTSLPSWSSQSPPPLRDFELEEIRTFGRRGNGITDKWKQTSANSLAVVVETASVCVRSEQLFRKATSNDDDDRLAFSTNLESGLEFLGIVEREVAPETPDAVVEASEEFLSRFGRQNEVTTGSLVEVNSGIGAMTATYDQIVQERLGETRWAFSLPPMVTRLDSSLSFDWMDNLPDWGSMIPNFDRFNFGRDGTGGNVSYYCWGDPWCFALRCHAKNPVMYTLVDHPGVKNWSLGQCYRERQNKLYPSLQLDCEDDKSSASEGRRLREITDHDTRWLKRAYIPQDETGEPTDPAMCHGLRFDFPGTKCTAVRSTLDEAALSYECPEGPGKHEFCGFHLDHPVSLGGPKAKFEAVYEGPDHHSEHNVGAVRLYLDDQEGGCVALAQAGTPHVDRYSNAYCLTLGLVQRTGLPFEEGIVSDDQCHNLEHAQCL